LAYERFYNTLTVVAAGAFVLSVTYLGNLKSAGGRPVDFWLLKASWALLLVCLIGSIFYHDFHTTYVHYARSREYAAKQRDHRQAALEESDGAVVVDEKGNPWDRSELRQSFVDEIARFASDFDFNQKKETSFARRYRFAGVGAQVTFLLGIALLFLFAIANT